MLRIVIAFIGLGTLVGLAFGLTWYSRELPPATVNPQDVQCGHWCIVRCAELLGVPATVEEIVALMPPTPAGHSLHQLAQALERVGLRSTGRRAPFESLENCPGPWIVHLTDPDHFIVLVSVEAREGRIHAFDPLGKHETIPVDLVRGRWSGKILEVSRPEPPEPLPRYLSRSTSAPCIQFQALFLDRGSLPANGQAATFEFDFENLGTAPLVIEAVRPSCACLQVDFPHEPVAAHGRGVITVRVNPGHTGGAFLHALDVQTNDPVQSHLRLKASGYVTTSLVINPPAIDLGNLLPGATVRRECFLRYHNTAEQLKLSDLTLKLPGAQAAWINHLDDSQAAQKLWPGATSDVDVPEGVSVIELTYRPPPEATGKISAILEARSNVAGFETLKIPVTGTVLQPVQFVPSILSFGEVNRQAFSEASIRLRSPTGGAFEIVSVTGVPSATGSDPVSINWKSSRRSDGLLELLVRVPGTGALAMNGAFLQVTIKLADAADPLTIACPVFAVEKR